MRFFDYLESSYASANIEAQKNYTAFGHAETQAVSDLMNGQRRFFKFIAYFKIIIQYIAVELHIIQKPLTGKEIIKNMDDEKRAEAEKLKADKQALALVKSDEATS